MDTVALIESAIRERKQVIAFYDGFRRELCPHVLGLHDGKYRCLFFQFGGETSEGRVGLEVRPGWRCMELDGLGRVELCDGPWHPEWSATMQPQRCVEVVLAEVRM